MQIADRKLQYLIIHKFENIKQLPKIYIYIYLLSSVRTEPYTRENGASAIQQVPSRDILEARHISIRGVPPPIYALRSSLSPIREMLDIGRTCAVFPPCAGPLRR